MNLRNTLAVFYSFALRIFGAKGLTKIPLFKQISIALSSYLRTHCGPTVVLDGNTIYLDPVDSLGLSITPYEPFSRALVREHVKSGDVFVDIGANIGVFTLLAAKMVGAEGKVYAFEPEPNNFALLSKSAKMNQYSNIVLTNKAVSNEAREIKLFLTDFNHGGHSFFNMYKDPEQFVYPHVARHEDAREHFVIVPAITIDEFLNNEKRVDFIKMDVQGAEGLVFEGMSAVLKNNPAVKIIAEFWPLAMQQLGTDVPRHLEELRKLGFSIFDIDERRRRLTKMTPEELLEHYPPEKNTSTNIFLTRDASFPTN